MSTASAHCTGIDRAEHPAGRNRAAGIVRDDPARMVGPWNGGRAGGLQPSGGANATSFSRSDTTAPPGASTVTANATGRRTGSVGLHRNDDLVATGRDVEHAAVDRVAVVARPIEDPELVAGARGVVRDEAAQPQESALAGPVPDDVSGAAALTASPAPVPTMPGVPASMRSRATLRTPLAEGAGPPRIRFGIDECAATSRPRPAPRDAAATIQGSHRRDRSEDRYRGTAREPSASAVASSRPCTHCSAHRSSAARRRRQRSGLVDAGRLGAVWLTQGVASPIFAGPSIFIHWRT